MWPTHYHRVRLHATQAARLDHVTDAFAWLLGHDALDKALNALLLHQVLQCLSKRRNERGSGLKEEVLIKS